MVAGTTNPWSPMAARPPMVLPPRASPYAEGRDREVFAMRVKLSTVMCQQSSPVYARPRVYCTWLRQVPLFTLTV